MSEGIKERETIREVVREKYAEAITSKGSTSCCSSERCCCGTNVDKTVDMITGNLYSADEISGMPAEAFQASFGCGNPTALAELKKGETVLDLGSGAGLDVLISAKRVGPHGKAYGLDMTDEMLREALRNKAKSGLENVEFLAGYLEDIPLPDNSVDVIISNCVINLSADKDAVLKEAYRVLKPGGRFAVSDIVLTRPLPKKIQQSIMAWAGCVAGALQNNEYLEKMRKAGFVGAKIEVIRVYDWNSKSTQDILPDLSVQEKKELDGAVVSAFVRAVKP